MFGKVSYGERFLMDYVGAIATDPKIAVAELIANASDAGARQVTVSWPDTAGKTFSVTDDGTGLSKDEFMARWNCLAYDRTKLQGDYAVFPPGVNYKGKRLAFGKHGKGRFAPFCFADEYRVQTTIGGTTTCATVRLPTSESNPFDLVVDSVGQTGAEHGTVISWAADKRGLSEAALIELIGSVFMLDPQFNINVNGKPIDLSSLEGIAENVINVPPHGQVSIYLIDTKDARRHNRPGVTWRVHKRLVGEPGWSEFDQEERFPNGRPEDSKRFCFLVQADILKPKVKDDWTGFNDSNLTVAVKNAVHDHVAASIRLLTTETRTKRKTSAISANGQAITK